MLVEQRLKGDKDKVLSSDLMIMHWNIYVTTWFHALCRDISLLKDYLVL